MFRKLLPILIIPALLFASHSITKNFNFERPLVKNNVVYMKGCRTMVKPFSPCVPSKPISLRLPQGEEAVSFDVTYSKPVTIKGQFYVQPFRPGGRNNVAPPQDYYTRSSSVYDVDAFYPAQIESPRFFTHFRYGHSIFIASLRPVQYNPVTGELKYFEKISVSVTTEKKRGPLPVYKFSPFIKSQLQVELDNPETLDGIPYTPRDGDDYDYALITTNALKDSWGDFLSFNVRRALKTKLATIEDINASNEGDHQADKLKNYLKKEYEDHDIMFVMLGGDDNISSSNQIQADAITHKPYTSEFKDYGTDYIKDTDVAADMFYETLDGQELEDLEWELYAARFPASNATELQRMINKTIKYSEDPDIDAVSKVILAGEKAWANINGGTCWGKDEMELLVGECTLNGYTTQGFDDFFSFTELYEVENNWSKTQLIDGINSGVNFLNHVGHSNNFMIMKLSMDSNDPQKLTNSMGYIGYTTGCYCGAWDNRKIAYNATFSTGHYTQDCIAEDFMGGTDGGAVAFISCTRFGLGDNGMASTDGTDGSSIKCERYLYDGFFNKKMHHLGVAQAYSIWICKQDILNTDIDAQPYFGQMEYVAYEINALGDPALSVWSDTPKELTADHPTSIAANATTFTWDTKNAYTAVALLDKDGKEIICSQVTGEDGECEISNDALKTYLAANIGEKLKINVKAYNYLPYQGEITIGGTDIVQKQNLSHRNAITFSRNSDKVRYSIPVQERATLSIYNAKGTLIKHRKINDQSGEIVLNDISSGIYYVQLKSKSISVAQRFTVSR